MALLPVADALAQVLAPAQVLTSETVSLGEAHGRVLAGPIHALRTQPGFDASAMDVKSRKQTRWSGAIYRTPVSGKG